MRITLAVLLATSVLSGRIVGAEEYHGAASSQQSARAIGHYARARSLLIAAMREFDAGRKVAEPSTLLDPNRWRQTLEERVKELERVLDPQPRSTSGGVTFSPDRRLLAEEDKKR